MATPALENSTKIPLTDSKGELLTDNSMRENLKAAMRKVGIGLDDGVTVRGSRGLPSQADGFEFKFSISGEEYLGFVGKAGSMEVFPGKDGKSGGFKITYGDQIYHNGKPVIPNVDFFLKTEKGMYTFVSNGVLDKETGRGQLYQAVKVGDKFETKDIPTDLPAEKIIELSRMARVRKPLPEAIIEAQRNSVELYDKSPTTGAFQLDGVNARNYYLSLKKDPEVAKILEAANIPF